MIDGRRLRRHINIAIDSPIGVRSCANFAEEMLIISILAARAALTSVGLIQAAPGWIDAEHWGLTPKLIQVCLFGYRAN